jgi:hypothetical protein
MKRIIILLMLPFVAFTSYGQVATVRDQAKMVNEMLDDRITNLLPQLMEES